MAKKKKSQPDNPVVFSVKDLASVELIGRRLDQETRIKIGDRHFEELPRQIYVSNQVFTLEEVNEHDETVWGSYHKG